MNDEDATTLLNRLAERVSVSPAPVEEVIRSGRKARGRRRRTTVLAVAASVALVLVGGFTVRQALQPARVTPVAGPDTGLATPPGTRLVGIGHAAIAVPEGWGTNLMTCGKPTTNTVVMDQGVVPLCATTLPQTVSDVELQVSPDAPAYSHAHAIQVDGVPALQTALRCTSEGTLSQHRYRLCTQALWVQQEQALFTVTSPRAATVRRLMSSVRVDPGHVAVPVTYTQGAERDARTFADTAKSLGLEVQTRVVGGSSWPAGWIVGVDPAVGSVLRPGDTVHVSVSSGAAPQSGHGTAPPPPACPLTPYVQQLVVTRTFLPGNGLTFGFPRRVTVHDPTSIARLVTALCATRRMPRGVTYSCPMDNGLVYHVAAFDGSGKPWSVDIRATGCSMISGMGQGRWTSGQVWRALASAMGVHPPTYQTLAGHPAGR